MSRNLRKTIITLTILAVMLLLVFLGFAVYRYYSTFRMTGTTPDTSDILAFTPYIDVNFNRRPVLYDEFLITSEAPEIMQEVEFRKTSIRIYLQDMRIDTNYDLEFSPVRSEGGDEIPGPVIEFTTQSGDIDDLPQEQQDYLLAQQDDKSNTLTDPILEYIPYSTLSFELSPLVTENEAGDSVLELRARILLSAADVRVNAEAAIKRYKQEVLSYITSVGFDPNNYIINFDVVEPTL